MEILHTRCAGIDVHKKNVKVCLIITDENGKRKKEFRTYLTMTQQLLELRDWLKEQECSHIAFEATGVYWKPVFNLLEGDFEILVVNAHHMKAVPGRKTDIKDAEWIADLLQHGLRKRELYPLSPPTRTARSHPLSSQFGRRACTRSQSASKDLRRYQPETGRRGQRCDGESIQHDFACDR